jgi:hypothetical protein
VSKLNLTPAEEQKLLELLERYAPELEMEIANTDDSKLHKYLKERHVFMMEILKRLKS